MRGEMKQSIDRRHWSSLYSQLIRLHIIRRQCERPWMLRWRLPEKQFFKRWVRAYSVSSQTLQNSWMAVLFEMGQCIFGKKKNGLSSFLKKAVEIYRWVPKQNWKTPGPWKKSYDKPRQHIKNQRHHFADKGWYSQSFVFSSSHVQM